MIPVKMGEQQVRFALTLTARAGHIFVAEGAETAARVDHQPGVLIPDLGAGSIAAVAAQAMARHFGKKASDVFASGIAAGKKFVKKRTRAGLDNVGINRGGQRAASSPDFDFNLVHDKIIIRAGSISTIAFE